MKKLFLTICVLLVASVAFAQTIPESVTVTTYYPRPVGVYKLIRLSPQIFNPVDCATIDDEGKIYYKQDDNTVMMCTGDAGSYNWVPIGSGGGLWNSGTDANGKDWVTPALGTQSVAIGTDTLSFNEILRVHNGAVLFRGDGAGRYQAQTPVAGAGTRFMWVSERNAIRAGYVDGGQWNSGIVGSGSIAFGYNPIARGADSIALGYDSTARGSKSVAIGAKIDVESVANSGFALGGAYLSQENTSVLSNGGTAIGSYAVAGPGGTGNIAIGRASTAAALFSAGSFNAIAIGTGSVANGGHSVAIGREAEASDDLSIAVGTSAHARGLRSLAMLGPGIAAGVTGGIGVGHLSMVIGSGGAGAALFENNIRSSLMVGFESGNSTLFAQTYEHAGSNIKNHVGINKIPPIVTNGWGGLDYALEVGGQYVGKTGGDPVTQWTANSDRAIKKDIIDLSDALEVIERLHPVRYLYSEEYIEKHPSAGGHEYYSFIAQEFQEVFPDNVNEDAQGYLGMDSYPVIPYLVTAVQELKDMSEELMAKNKELKLTLQELQLR